MHLDFSDALILYVLKNERCSVLSIHHYQQIANPSCDDMLKSFHHYEDSQYQMSDAEVMTIVIVAMFYPHSNFKLASRYPFEQGYMPKMLSACHFNRRRHHITDLFLTLFLRLGEIWKKLNVVLLVPACSLNFFWQVGTWVNHPEPT